MRNWLIKVPGKRPIIYCKPFTMQLFIQLCSTWLLLLMH